MATKVQQKSLISPFVAAEIERDLEVGEADATSAPLPWLTVETLLYGIIFIVAMALRLWRLGAYPLSSSEAAQSLVALELVRGGAFETDYYSPLLVTLNTFSFLLFGASDASARLASVLLGTLLVILPITLRRQLGTLVCLLAAALLAISPTALYLSRTLNSEIGVAAGALMIVAGFFNWVENGQQRWLLLLAGGLALMLAAGPMAYSILVVFSLIVIFKLSTFKALWSKGLYLSTTLDSSAEPSSVEAQPIEISLREDNGAESVYRLRHPAAAAATTINENQSSQSHSDAETEADAPEDVSMQQNEAQEIEKQPQHISSQSGQVDQSKTEQNLSLRNAVLFFAVTLVFLTTAALFNLNGFSMLAASLREWLGSFSFQNEGDTGFNAVFLLTVYEPLLIFAGLIGLTLVIIRGNLVATILTAWFVGMLLLDVAMVGRPNSNVILVLTPLAFSAAFALAELWRRVRDQATWGNEGILLMTGLAIIAFGYIGLTGWLTRVCDSAELACQYAWLQSVAALLLFVVIVTFFAIMSDAGAALRGAALVAVAVGLLSAINIGWRLNYGPLMHLAYQPLSGIPAATGLQALTDTLAEQSARRVGDETLLDVTVSGLSSPALQWQLRDYKYLNSAGLVQSAPATAIITPETTELGLGQGYIGQDFPLDAIWSPVGLSPKALINWLIYRQADDLPQGNKVVLWLRVDEG